MNTGIELLVKRIKDCPDEFVESDSWNRLMDLFSNFITCFTDEEKKAVDNALQEAKREVFTGKVMEIIANGEVIGDFNAKYAQQPMASKIAISPQQYNSALAIASGNQALTQQSLMNAAAQIANLK